MSTDYFTEHWLLVYLFVGVLAFAMLSPLVQYYATHFEKVIAVKDKYMRHRRRCSIYTVVDTDNTIYQVGNVWFKGDFNRSDEYVRLRKGATCSVKGFGYRWGVTNSYRQLYEFKEVGGQ
jgi:hypothetical protein